MKQQIPEQGSTSKQRFWNRDRIFQIVTLIVVVMLCSILIWQRDNIAAFSIWLGRYAGLKYLGILIISIATSAPLVIPLPGLAFTSIMGAITVYPADAFWVGLVSGIGATIGELTGYLLGYSSRMAVPDNKKYEKVVSWTSRWGSWTIFVLALLPNPLFDLAGLAAGILKYPMWKFLTVGMAGRIPKHMLFAYLGFWGTNIMTPI